MSEKFDVFDINKSCFDLDWVGFGVGVLSQFLKGHPKKCSRKSKSHTDINLKNPPLL